MPEVHTRSGPREADTPAQALASIGLKMAQEIIEGLPPRQKTIAHMKWEEQKTGPEIAAELGIAESTVNVQVHTIRRKLVDGLGPYYPFGTDSTEGETP
jgi:RNA polymerase sigma factor (sigma-70 family)